MLGPLPLQVGWPPHSGLGRPAAAAAEGQGCVPGLAPRVCGRCAAHAGPALERDQPGCGLSWAEPAGPKGAS